MNEIDKILEGLVQRTDDGKLKWNPSAESGEFVASVGAISVVVRQLSESYLHVPARHQLEILNDEGSTVEVLETNDEYGLVPSDRRATIPQAQILSSLYVLARRSALNTQSTLEKLARDLGA